MSEEPLSYQSSLSPRAARFVVAAWITLLVVGILYCLEGMCIGGSFAFALLRGAVRARVSTPVIVAVAVAEMVISFGVGITYLWTSMLVRKASGRAAAIAGYVALGNVALMFLIAGVMVTMLAARASATEAWITGIVDGTVLFLGAATNVVIHWLCRRARREMRLQG